MLTILLESLKNATFITFSLVSLGLILYGLYHLPRLIGRPLVRRLFDLAYSDDAKALRQTGDLAIFVFGLLFMGIWICKGTRERDEDGQVRTEWTSDQLLRILTSSILEAVLVEGMLSAVAILLPRFGRGVDEGERPIMVPSLF